MHTILDLVAAIRDMITVPIILLSAITLVAIKFLYQIVYYKFFHPLRHYPGPFWAGVTRLWGGWHFFRGTETKSTWKAVQKYGPIVRISPTMLLVADSTLIPSIYHRKATKTRFYLADMFQKPGSIVIQDPAKHAAHRRLIAATYALSNIQRMESLLDKHILRWVTKVGKAFAEEQKPIDLSAWTAFLSYDTITDVGFRNPLGFIESGTDIDGLIQGFHLGMLLFGTAGRLYTFFEWIVRSPFLKRYTTIRPQQSFGFGLVLQRARAVLEERTKALEEGRTMKSEKGDASYDFLQAFMDTRTPEGNHLDAETIQTEIFVILGAGADGFSSACTSLLLEILSNPSYLKRVIAEIRTAVRAGQLSQPVPTYTEIAKSLPFYGACVREAGRLHPVASTLLPREVTATDPEIVLAGKKVPPGTELACNPWISHRDKAIYGEDAEVFNPDRWLVDTAQAKVYEKYNLSWGGGSRVCLGKHFAIMMLYKAPVALFMNFEAALCKDTPETPKPSSRVHGPGLLWSDLWVHLSKRNPCSAEETDELRSFTVDAAGGMQ